MGSRILRAFVVGGCAWAAAAQVLAAVGCDPMLADRPAVYEAVVALHSGERAVRSVKLPARTNVIVFAREGDLDVTLEVRKAATLVGRADSSIRRNTIQRVSFTTNESADYTLTFLAKHSSGAAQSIDARILALTRIGLADVCTAAQLKLAAADQAYAAAHDVTSATLQTALIDAASMNKLAARSYHDAATLLAKSGPSLLLASAQHAEAAMYNYDLRDWAQTEARAREAAETYAAVGDLSNRARVLGIAAEARLETASALPQTAAGGRAEVFAGVRASLTELAAFHSQRGERYDEGRALNNIAISHYMQGSYQEALPAYQRALAVFERANERAGEAMALQNSALVEYELGHPSEAAPHYAKVLELIREADDPQGFVFVLNNSALANWAGGHYDTALHQFNEALRIATALQDPYIQGLVLHNIGCVYYTFGDHERALDLFRQALTLRTAQVNAQGRTATLRAIGNILRERGGAAEALKVHEEALSLATTPQMRTLIELQTAKDLAALGQHERAQERLQSVLANGGPGGELTRARALAERSTYLLAQGQATRAEADLRRAQVIFHRNEAAADELEAWVTLAGLFRKQGATDQAFNAIDRALALAEEVRLQTANPELRASLLQPLRPAFDLKIALLADRYFAPRTSAAERERTAMQALLTAEQARARAMEDLQSFDVTAPGIPPELVVERRTIYRELAARRSRLETILDRANEQDARAIAIRADIATLRQKLDDIDARIGAASGRAHVRTDIERQPVSLASVPQEVALIEYWLGARDAYAWVLTREGLTMARLSSSDEVNNLARAYHEALRGFGVIPLSRRLELGEQLYQRVLAQFDGRIAGKRTLVLALDGALHYVPFATLRVANGATSAFLVERHDLAVTPSIGMFLAREAPRGRQQPTREMLLVADPVYETNDARLASPPERVASTGPPRIPPMLLVRGGERGGALPRLPSTAQEAATIAALLPKAGIDRLEGFTATRDRFLTAGLERYRFIHVASHAVNDAEIPQASALVLSTVDARSRAVDGRVLAADFVNVQLNAEVVVLSACDTALGKSVAGEGLIGLQYVVLARGAQSVVSSLWPVIDQASADLMSQFYTSHLRRGASLPSALSEAMRSMLAGRFKDPGVWGAFTLTVARTGGT